MAADEMTAREMFDALVDRLVAAERGYGAAQTERDTFTAVSSQKQREVDEALRVGQETANYLRAANESILKFEDMHRKATVIFEAAATMNLVAANRAESPPFDPQAMDALSKALKDTDPIPF